MIIREITLISPQDEIDDILRRDIGFKSDKENIYNHTKNRISNGLEKIGE